MKMEQAELTQKIKEIIAPILFRENLLLVESDFARSGNDYLLRLLVDRPGGGITLDECSRLNAKIGLALDSVDILTGRYILEVSSPGLDRPLKTKDDFLRCLNKEVKFFFKHPVDGKMEVNGKIKAADEDLVNVDSNGIILTIPLPNIAKAKQELEYFRGRL